jgi:hypothetical protein
VPAKADSLQLIRDSMAYECIAGRNLFRSWRDQIIDMNRPLVAFVRTVD